jgi:hypothetical protein
MRAHGVVQSLAKQIVVFDDQDCEHGSSTRPPANVECVAAIDRTPAPAGLSDNQPFFDSVRRQPGGIVHVKLEHQV